MQRLTHAITCLPLLFHLLFHGKYRSHGTSLVHISRDLPCRRKEVESKHHGAVKELTSEHQRFDWTEILYSLRKNGGYIRSSLGGRSVLVVRQAGWQVGRRKSYCLRNFQNPVTWLLMRD